MDERSVDDQTDDHAPLTEPAGALVPPPRYPPTALATAAPLPPRPPRPTRTTTTVSRRISFPFLAAAFDELDALGDAVARAVGLR